MFICESCSTRFRRQYQVADWVHSLRAQQRPGGEVAEEVQRKLGSRGVDAWLNWALGAGSGLPSLGQNRSQPKFPMIGDTFILSTTRKMKVHYLSINPWVDLRRVACPVWFDGLEGSKALGVHEGLKVTLEKTPAERSPGDLEGQIQFLLLQTQRWRGSHRLARELSWAMLLCSSSKLVSCLREWQSLIWIERMARKSLIL